jgi:hypothetical protein
VAESDAGEEFRRLFERSNRNLLAQAYLLTDDRAGSLPSGLARLATDRGHTGTGRMASSRAPQPRREPVAKFAQAISSPWRRCLASCTGTGRRSTGRRESTSILAPETTRGARVRRDLRPDDRTSGPGDESKRGQCPGLGLSGKGELGTSAGSGPRTGKRGR